MYKILVIFRNVITGEEKISEYTKIQFAWKSCKICP